MYKTLLASLPSADNNLTRIPKTIFSAIIVCTILTIAIATCWTLGDNEPGKLSLEIIKLTLQLILIVVFGSIVTNETAKRRERKNALSAFRKKLLNDTINTYMDVKRVRRLLRAKCTGGSGESSQKNLTQIPYKVYDKQVNRLIEIQLSLEIKIHELNNHENSPIFQSPGSITGLKSQFKEMECYLYDIIYEYENILTAYDKQPKCIPLSRLVNLAAFIQYGTTTDPSPFRENFTEYFKKTLTLLRTDK